MVAAPGVDAGAAAPSPAVPVVGPAAGSASTRRLGSARRDLLAKALAVIAALGLWQASSAFLRPIFISTPYNVAVSLVDLIKNGQLPGAFLSSLVEMMAGLVIATAVAIVVGLLMGRIRLVERALDPVVAFGNATPSIALLPIMEVWFGLGSEARIAFIMVICTWPLLVNTYAGAKAVRGRYLDVGSAFGMSGWQQTWKIYLPGAMPFIFVGLRIALAVGAVGMILGGQEIGQSGLGGLTADFGSYSETANLVATIVTTTALAMFLFGLFRRIQNWQFPWIAATSAGRRQAK
jgi:ABC-type nitrate/sulfonate/bicarbonate transport system permease component